MSTLTKLKLASDLSDFALLLKYKPRTLSYILYKIPYDARYTSFPISKKTGGYRIISAPVPKYKLLQRKLSNLLYECVNELYDGEAQAIAAHGFMKRPRGSTVHESRSIKSNAAQHTNRRYVFNVDLADFFGSINFGRVRGFFIKDQRFNLQPEVATIIAQICCHDNFLPQGSPSSPIISNLIASIIDARLARLSKKHGCSYTRYVDDLTFSTNHKVFPESIAFFSEKSAEWSCGRKLLKTIDGVGFAVNEDKTRMQIRGSRQSVTGLNVNVKVNVNQRYYRSVRSMCNSLFGFGTFYLGSKKHLGTLAKLDGMLNYIYDVKRISQSKQERTDLLLKNLSSKVYKSKKNQQHMTREALPAHVELYSKFLFHRYFCASDRPTIITEGKTDIVHLKLAIKGLKRAAAYNFQYDYKFFKFTQKIRSIMRINDGTTGLIWLMSHYKALTSHSKILRKQPVIIVCDNDKEGRSAVDKIAKDFNHEGVDYKDKEGAFYHVCDNLFLVTLPRLGGKITIIEDLYDSEVKATSLEGKTLCTDNKSKKNTKDSSTYGKTIFVERVIASNWENINFKNFVEVFSQIDAAIQAYALMHKESTTHHPPT